MNYFLFYHIFCDKSYILFFFQLREGFHVIHDHKHICHIILSTYIAVFFIYIVTKYSYENFESKNYVNHTTSFEIKNLPLLLL